MARLSPRERGLVISAAIFVGIAGHYALYDHALTERGANLERLQKADTIQAALLRLPETGAGRTGTDLPLARRLTETAADYDIAINRLDPQGTAIAVSIGDVTFSQFLSWVESASMSGGAVLSAEIGRSPEPGIVSANIVWGLRQ